MRRLDIDSEFFKKGSAIGLGVIVASAFLWWSLPVTIKRYTDVTHGEQLISRLDTYLKQKRTLPADTDWVALNRLGFTEDELERAYPHYEKLVNSVYALVFVSDFDGPYLTWVSTRRKWEVTSGRYPSFSQKHQ